MGYTTTFSGQVNVVPPLNQAEIDFLNAFAATRRVQRTRGPYYVGDRGCGVFSPGRRGIDGETDVTNMNRPPEGQPGLWCQWIPTDDGTAIQWDCGEKFYDSEEWMQYLIDHFLKPGAEASKSGDPQFAGFTFDHVCNGEIEAAGESGDDFWLLVVKDNDVSTKQGRITYED